MRIPIRASRILYAGALMGLGIAGIVNGGLALVWQHIPLSPGPLLTAIAYACAAVEFLCGLGLLFPQTVTLAVRILFPYMALWALLLKLPVILLKPLDIDSWGTFGEVAIITVGAWCLFASHAGAWEKQRLGFLVGEQGIRWARLLLVVSLPPQGLVHFLNIQNVAAFVPAWLPFHLAWAYLTGAGFMAAAAAIVFGVLPRLAANLLAFQVACIALFTWGALLDTGRTACTAFLISAAIGTGVWLLADTYRGTQWFAAGKAARGISLD